MLRTHNLNFLDISIPSRNAKPLIDWLNANQNNDSYRRLVAILEGIRKAEELRDALSRLFRKLNGLLSEYKVYPQFGPIGERLLPTTWIPARCGQFHSLIAKKCRSKDAKEIDKCNAALLLLQLA